MVNILLEFDGNPFKPTVSTWPKMRCASWVMLSSKAKSSPKPAGCPVGTSGFDASATWTILLLDPWQRLGNLQYIYIYMDSY